MFLRTSPADRFIPRRYCEDFNLAHYKLQVENDDFNLNNYKDVFENNSKYINHARNNFNKRVYARRLWDIVAPYEKNILNFSDPRCKTGSPKSCIESNEWPVKPRKKPLICAPSTVLDMPDLDTNIRHNVIDWGSKGYLATVYEKEVHLWNVDKKMPYVLTNTGSRVKNCVRWNKDGTKFAMALINNEVAIWDLEKDKIVDRETCTCGYNSCTITAMEWSPDNHFLTGCSRGRIIIWTGSLIYIKSLYPAHNDAIINLSFSCQGKHLVTTGIDCKVRLYIWSQIKEYIEITYTQPVKAITWHPWKDSLLGLGVSERSGSLTLWNVNAQKEYIYTSPIHNHSLIDCLTWNSITGELVVSYWFHNPSEEHLGRNLIVVLSNVNKISDAIEYHVGRVPYLIWGDEGLQLATASTDENLCIWDFLGTSIERQRAKKRIKLRREKFTTDGLKNLNIFGCRIR